MIIQLSEKVWYILKIDIAAWLAAILLIYYIVHWSKRFMLDEMTLHQIYWGIAGSYDPDLPLNLGSKIRSQSRFKIGIGSDRNGSEVIKIDRDCEKIVHPQCTAVFRHVRKILKKVGLAGRVWTSCRQFGESWSELGQVGPSWCKLGKVGASWDQLGHVETSWGTLGQVGVTWWSSHNP